MVNNSGGFLKISFIKVWIGDNLKESFFPLGVCKIAIICKERMAFWGVILKNEMQRM